MIAQLLFSILLASVFLYAWSEYRRSPVVALLAFGVAVGGLYFVWFPADSTRLAEFVGVGRGADLVLYTWVCISLIIVLNLHLKLRTQHELITRLARTIALANVTVPLLEDDSSAKDPQAKSSLRAEREATSLAAMD